MRTGKRAPRARRTSTGPVKAALRPHPHLFQINTYAWLERLSAAAGRPITLGGVADMEWDRLRDLGFDIVYLLGVWERSPAGRRIARADPALFRVFDRALPEWTLSSVVGSAFSIRGYEPEKRIGTWTELDGVRDKLHARGMRLVLDFVSNHTGPDHRWVSEHPEYFICGSERDYRRDPLAFHMIERANEAPVFVARGRDPYFPPWSDTAQLDHFNRATRAAMIETLRAIAGHCDGVRCDMAMLALNDVFGRTWGALIRDREAPQEEFWAEAIAALPRDFLWMAEVYWDMEARLLELGFDYAYDKGLYDRLLGAAPQDLRAHLGAEMAYQKRMARFIENHDEARSVAAFGRQRIPGLAAMLATLPGLRFFQDGQLQGRSLHLPMQLGAVAAEPPDRDLEQLYTRVLRAAVAPVFHLGEWKLLATAAENDDSHLNLIAYRWRAQSDYWLFVLNCTNVVSHARLHVAAELDGCARYVFADLLDGGEYVRERAELLTAGLYVRLPAYGAHLFHVRALPDRPGSDPI